MKKEIKVTIGYQKFYFDTIDKAIKFTEIAADASPDQDVININIKYIREENDDVTEN